MSDKIPYAWEITRMVPHSTDEKKMVRCSMVIMAHDIEQVWEYLAADRADASVEIESIVRIAPIVAVVPPPPEAEVKP